MPDAAAGGSRAGLCRSRADVVRRIAQTGLCGVVEARDGAGDDQMKQKRNYKLWSRPPCRGTLSQFLRDVAYSLERDLRAIGFASCDPDREDDHHATDGGAPFLEKLKLVDEFRKRCCEAVSRIAGGEEVEMDQDQGAQGQGQGGHDLVRRVFRGVIGGCGAYVRRIEAEISLLTSLCLDGRCDGRLLGAAHEEQEDGGTAGSGGGETRQLLPEVAGWMTAVVLPFSRLCYGLPATARTAAEFAAQVSAAEDMLSRREDLVFPRPPRAQHNVFGEEEVDPPRNFPERLLQQLRRFGFSNEDPEYSRNLYSELVWYRVAASLAVFCVDSFAAHRCAQAFDIFKLYPDSLPALSDLRLVCRATTRNRHRVFGERLVHSLHASFRKRLLIAGVETKQVSMRYLQARKDTVRCVVAAVTEEGGFLHAEFSVARPTMKLLSLSSLEEDTFPRDIRLSVEVWVPGPLLISGEAAIRRMISPGFPPRKRKSEDLISLLVSIYGSPECFVREYREILAERVLAKPPLMAGGVLRKLLRLRIALADCACELRLLNRADLGSGKLSGAKTTSRQYVDECKRTLRGRNS
eukprot:g3654.t1